MKKNRRMKPVLSAVACCSLLAQVACSGADNTSLTRPGDATPGEETEVEPNQPGTPADEETPVYVISTLITGDDGSNAYVRLVDDLALSGDQVELDEAREFPGQSDVAVFGGSLLVASGDEPTITRYRVDQDLELQPEAQARVNFTSYGLTSAAFWNNQFVADDKAYMLNGASEIVIWNPEAMEIEGTIALPELEQRAGLRVVAGLADRASVVHDGKFYLSLYWTDESYADRSDDSVLVVVDVATDTVDGTISANCPGLDYATADEEGRLHFSNWTGGPGTYYVLGTAQNCIATLDPATGEVTTTPFAEIAGGHEGAAFEYAGNGRFVMSIFDEVRADVENADEPFGPVGGTNWQLWTYQPATGESAPIEDVDWNSGAIIHAPIGDDLYSLVPGADYASTVVYKLGSGQSAEAEFGVTGWSFRLFQVR
jgi:hypothetical protein